MGKLSLGPVPLKRRTFPSSRRQMPSPDPTTTFVVKYLLHPEARRGTVEQAEQVEVVVLGRIGRQLDDGGRLLEHLSASIEHEVVVRGDRERRYDRGCLKAGKHRILIPSLPVLYAHSILPRSWVNRPEAMEPFGAASGLRAVVIGNRAVPASKDPISNLVLHPAEMHAGLKEFVAKTLEHDQTSSSRVMHMPNRSQYFRAVSRTINAFLSGPPPLHPMLHGWLANVVRGTSAVEVKSSSVLSPVDLLYDRLPHQPS